MGDWKPDRVVTVDVPDKPIGREKRSRLYLWTVPATMSLPRLDPSPRRPAAPPCAGRVSTARALRPGIVHLGLGAFARAHLAGLQRRRARRRRRRRRGACTACRCATPTRAMRWRRRRACTRWRCATPTASALRVHRLRVIGSLCRCCGARGPGRGARRASPRRHAHRQPDRHREGLLPRSGERRAARWTIRTSRTTSRIPTRRAARSASSSTAWRCGARRTPASAVDADVARQPAGQRRHAARPGAGLRRAPCPAAWCDWIERECSFPNSMVDRIVPRSHRRRPRRSAAALGLRRRLARGRRALPGLGGGRPLRRRAAGLARGGARFVERAAPWEHLKLRMVNGAHSAIAYLGLLAGWATVDAAISQPALRGFVEALMRDEIAPTLAGALPGVDLGAYRASCWRASPTRPWPTARAQIAMDGSQKLPQRLLGTVRDRLAVGAPVDRLALALAAWLHHLRGHRRRRTRATPSTIRSPRRCRHCTRRRWRKPHRRRAPRPSAASRRSSVTWRTVRSSSNRWRAASMPWPRRAWRPPWSALDDEQATDPRRRHAGGRRDLARVGHALLRRCRHERPRRRAAVRQPGADQPVGHRLARHRAAVALPGPAGQRHRARAAAPSS